MTRERSFTGATRPGLRELAIAFLFLLLVLLTVRSAFALQINAVDAPASVPEGAALAVGFTTDVPAMAYSIARDGVPVSATYTYATTLPMGMTGTTIFTFQATLGNVTVNATRAVEIRASTFTISLLEPSATDYATAQVPFSLSTSVATDLCYVVAQDGTRTLDKLSATDYSGSLTLADGIHSFTVKCARDTTVVERNVTLRVDTAPPQVTLSPNGAINDAPVTLVATTNEASTCRYGPENGAFEQLPFAFPETVSLTHSATLSLDEGSYTYYAACRDALGNTAAPTSTSFAVHYRPSASVSVEGKNPRKAGTYEVTLTVSAALQAIPSLTLTYQSGGVQTLALAQTDALTYEGYLIIPDDAGEQVGSFSFRGKDLAGIEGTRITQDELFVVDTVKPFKVQTFQAVNATGAINLTWYDEQQDVSYRLYRSSVPGVTYNDLLTSTIARSYEDFDVRGMVNYFYRVAAVDAAGNVGELSHEEFASAAAVAYAEQRIGAALDPIFQVGLDERLRALDSRLLDVDRAVRDMQVESDQGRGAFLGALSLLEAAQAGRQKLQAMRTKLETLRASQLSREEYNAKVAAFQAEIDGIQATLPLSFSVTNRVAYDESPAQDALRAAIDRVYSAKTLSAADRSDIERRAGLLRDATRISTVVMQGAVTYADGLVQPYTIVEKRVTAQEQQRDVLAIETIPKAVAAHASDILFLKQQPVVLVDDPVVQYSYESLVDERISYALKGTIDVPSVQQSSLVFVPKPSSGSSAPLLSGSSADASGASDASSASSTGGFLTGNAILAGISGGSSALLVLIGIIIVGSLLVYYFRMDQSPSSSDAAQAWDPRQAIVNGVSPAFLAPLATPFVAATQTYVIERKEETLVDLLSRGQQLIDENKYLDAAYFYRLAHARFAQERFPSAQLKEAMRQEIETLHAKLNLFDAARTGHDAVAVQDMRSLADCLERMRAGAIVVGDAGTPMLEKMKLEYRYLYAKYSELRIGNAADGSGTEEESI